VSPTPSYAARRDAVEPEIIGEYQRAGWSVEPLNGRGIPDLLVAPPGERPDLVECKTGNATLSADQVEWHKRWGGRPPLIVRTAAQARKHIRMRTEERQREIAAAVNATREPYPFDTPASGVEGKP
jgi:hypothetical protein